MSLARNLFFDFWYRSDEAGGGENENFSASESLADGLEISSDGFSLRNFEDDNFSQTENLQNLRSEKISQRAERKKIAKKNFARQWAIAPAKHRRILAMLRDGVGIREVARTVGVGMRTIYRRKDLIDAELAREVSADDGGDAIQFSTLARGAKVCSVHGAVTVWPCVACAAMQGARGRGRG